MAKTDALVPFEDAAENVLKTPGVFIALDVVDHTTQVRLQLVGTFLRWQESLGHQCVILAMADGGSDVTVPWYNIERGYWAPMGYRP